MSPAFRGGFGDLKRNSAWRWFLVLTLMGISSVWAGEVGNEWRVVINIPSYTLQVYHGTQIWDSFPVAVGKPDTPSPVGDFWIANKVTDPVWYPQGKKPVPQGANNPLGRYWLGLNKKGYGIHGNNAPLSIGHPVSKGCFRMANQDIERLFQVLPKGTPVQVIYRTALGEMDEEKRLWLKIFSDFYQRDNLEQAVNQVLTDFSPDYPAHYGALKILLQHGPTATIEVPRRLEVAGDCQTGDAFQWNREVYLRRSHFNFEVDPVTAAGESSLFSEYIQLTALQGEGPSRRYKYSFDEASGIVYIYVFKAYYNENEFTDLGKFNLGKPWINLQRLANLLGSRFEFNGRNGYATVGRKRVKGLIDGEGFWIAPSLTVDLFPELGVIWDETSWTLKLVKRPAQTGL